MQTMLLFHHYNSAVGAGLCLLHIVQAIKNDYRVIVILPHGGNLPGKIRELGVEVIETENTPVSYRHYNGSTDGFFSVRHFLNVFSISKDKATVCRYIKKYNPDFVAVNSMTLFWIGKIAKRLNKTTICFHRETYKRGLLGLRTRIIKQSLVKHFDAVAYISHFDRIATGRSQNKAVRITDKVDLSLYKDIGKDVIRYQLKLPNEKTLLLYTGGFSELKGGLTAVRALKYIKDSSVGIVFLQADDLLPQCNAFQRAKTLLKRWLRKDYRYRVERFVHKNNLNDRVFWFPTTDRVERFFLACDAVVFPSMLPHQARPIYEAGAAGIPVFISDFLNTREFVNEQNGYCFKSGSSKDLARVIEHWLRNPEEAVSVVQCNIKKTLQNHDLSTLREELICFLGDEK